MGLGLKRAPLLVFLTISCSCSVESPLASWINMPYLELLLSFRQSPLVFTVSVNSPTISFGNQAQDFFLYFLLFQISHLIVTSSSRHYIQCYFPRYQCLVKHKSSQYIFINWITARSTKLLTPVLSLIHSPTVISMILLICKWDAVSSLFKIPW